MTLTGRERQLAAVIAHHKAVGHKLVAERVGERFGNLTVLALLTRASSTWRVQTRCDCGREYITYLNNLVQGLTTSCGCFGRLRSRAAATTHGMSHSTEYRSWQAMVARCTDPSAPGWKRYGGRGITVCERWQTFENFLADMGRKPSAALSIGRIDNDGHYEPGNCRWETAMQQARNTSRTQWVEHEGKRVPASELYSTHGVSRQLYAIRVGNGWPPYEAATTAPGTRRSA